MKYESSFSHAAFVFKVFLFVFNGAEGTNLGYLVLDYHCSKFSALKQLLAQFQVISARKGEFETGFERGGQTREHAMLVKTAGVKNLVVLINKMDDPTVNWDEERCV